MKVSVQQNSELYGDGLHCGVRSNLTDSVACVRKFEALCRNSRCVKCYSLIFRIKNYVLQGNSTCIICFLLWVYFVILQNYCQKTCGNANSLNIQTQLK